MDMVKQSFLYKLTVSSLMVSMMIASSAEASFFKNLFGKATGTPGQQQQGTQKRKGVNPLLAGAGGLAVGAIAGGLIGSAVQKKKQKNQMNAMMMGGGGMGMGMMPMGGGMGMSGMTGSIPYGTPVIILPASGGANMNASSMMSPQMGVSMGMQPGMMAMPQMGMSPQMGVSMGMQPGMMAMPQMGISGMMPRPSLSGGLMGAGLGALGNFMGGGKPMQGALGGGLAGMFGGQGAGFQMGMNPGMGFGMGGGSCPHTSGLSGGLSMGGGIPPAPGLNMGMNPMGGGSFGMGMNPQLTSMCQQAGFAKNPGMGGGFGGQGSSGYDDPANFPCHQCTNPQFSFMSRGKCKSICEARHKSRHSPQLSNVSYASYDVRSGGDPYSRYGSGQQGGSRHGTPPPYNTGYNNPPSYGQAGAYPPNAPPQYAQQGGYPPSYGQAGAYPPNAPPQYAQQQGGGFPPQAGGGYPPQAGGGYPPQQGGRPPVQQVYR